ncbi:hypothetical protein FRFR103141_06310 [Fructilactobacillus fructivorans]|uniref:hypothetical protein n=1 Tax=Fructilactobacillus fructivorans TaxID=1614 RepID=UPI00070AAA50|nr:hypothetical protein [Fructilactobacillus fructivorans]KRN40883.1 hypothetical protein IV51_GL001110 [Fructilactobacillus fructivorans]
MSKGNKRITQRDVRLLDETLKNKENEKDVENAWRTIFRKYFVENNDKESSPEMNSPYNVDGLITTHELIPTKLLMEFKDGTDLNKDYDRSRIMAQCIHYMHIFKEQGESLPNVIVGADENQAFVLYAPNFYHYVDDNKYNWDTRPSDAYRNDTKLMDDLTKDPNMKVWTYDFLEKGITLKQEYLNIKNMFDEIDSYTKLQGDNFKVSVTDKNINGLFLQFEKIVLKNSTKVNPVDAVNAFMKLLLVEDQDEYYQNPGNHNKLHLPNDKSIDINGSEFQIFFKRYDRNFSPNEKDRLKDMVDRLIKDDERRKSGDFWTPTIWADQADKVLQKSFGNNYKNEALIWDCAAGDKNLTRDFSYDMLFSSTIHQGEVNLSSHRNPEAISFRYDFLNDDVDKNPTDNPDPSNWKMPNRLYNNLIDASRTGKNVIFYTNPPFATENSNKRTNGKSKSSNSKNNKIVSFMKEHNLGGSNTTTILTISWKNIKVD